jgi:hypothetical protein
MTACLNFRDGILWAHSSALGSTPARGPCDPPPSCAQRVVRSVARRERTTSRPPRLRQRPSPAQPRRDYLCAKWICNTPQTTTYWEQAMGVSAMLLPMSSDWAGAHPLLPTVLQQRPRRAAGRWNFSVAHRGARGAKALPVDMRRSNPSARPARRSNRSLSLRHPGLVPRAP